MPSDNVIEHVMSGCLLGCSVAHQGINALCIYFCPTSALVRNTQIETKPETYSYTHALII